jgi:hypothetical protein
MSTPTKPPTDSQIIAGGEEVAVQYRGQPATAFVRQIRPTELTRYMQAESAGEEDVLKFVARISGEPVDLDALDLPSYELLLEADQRQNFTAARAREKREIARAARQLQVLRDSDPDTYRALQRKQSAAMESLLGSLAQSSAEGAPGQSAAT